MPVAAGGAAGASAARPRAGWPDPATGARAASRNRPDAWVDVVGGHLKNPGRETIRSFNAPGYEIGVVRGGAAGAEDNASARRPRDDPGMRGGGPSRQAGWMRVWHRHLPRSPEPYPARPA